MNAANDGADLKYLSAKGSFALWFGLLGAPAAWFVGMMIAYFTVPWACSHENTLPLHLIAAIGLVVTALAGVSALRIWRSSGREWSDDVADRHDRSRFMAEMGMAGSLLFGLLILGIWAAIIILGPCVPLPRVPFTPDALLDTERVLLAHVGAPLAPHDLWRAWSIDPAIILSLIWGGVFYGAGLQYAPRRLRARAGAFIAGCLVLVLALLSPLHALSEVLFSAHMAQHMLLVAVAAPLIVLGRPVLMSLWGFSRARRRVIAHHPVSRAVAACGRLSPARAFLVHGVTVWLWHAPALYQAALGSALLHALQHVSFLLTAILFWNAILDVRHRGASYGAGVFYTFATAVHTSILGALMTLAPVAWYPRYGVTAEAWGMTLLEDQQLAGLIMWVPAGFLYTLAALLLLAAWMRESEIRIRASRITAAASLVLAVVFLACEPPGVSRNAMDAERAAALTGASVDRGKDLLKDYGCGGCHTIDGVTGANGLVGPPLDGISQRVYIAGVLTNSPQNMALWIQDPQAVDSLTAMPTMGITYTQALDMTAYLYTLD